MNTLPPSSRPRRSWRDKFRDAFHGLKLGIRGHSSFAVHFFAAALVVLTALILGCEPWEWGLLTLAIGLVLTAELGNSALETLFRGLDPQARERAWQCLDVGAAAVLMASFTALVLGGIVFGPKFVHLFIGAM